MKSKTRSEPHKRFWASMTKSERSAYSAKRVNAATRTHNEKMKDPAYRKEHHERRRLGTLHQWAKRTKAEKIAFGKKISASVSAVHNDPDSSYNTLEYHKALSDGWERNKKLHLKTLESGREWKPGRKSKQRGRNISAAKKKFYAEISDEDYAIWLNKVRAGTKKAENRRPNKTESALWKTIKRYGFVYTGDRAFWIGRANPDFVNRKLRLVVELFGRYYHTDATADKLRLAKIKKAGWKTLVIWDDLFRRDPERQVDRIKRFVERYS